MIQRDFVLRQIQQLAQALAAVLQAARSGRADQTQQTLEQGVEAALGVSLGELRRADRADLVTRYGSGSADPALGFGLAELLARDASPEGRWRALWLYQDAAGLDPRPIDVGARIDALRLTLD